MSWVALVDRALRRGLPGRCTFCLASGCREPWCETCFEALPWNLPACPLCGEPQQGQLVARLCGHCLGSPPAFAAVKVPLRYEGPIAGLVQRFKFHASPRAGAVLLELLMAGLPPASRDWPDALVPVPLHPRRARERGFDQAAWLARRLAGRLGHPLVRAQRLRDTPSQRGLTRSQRRGNLRRVFRVASPLPPRVVLVDDVMTTGATLNALALACREGGAEEIQAWALARTPRPDL
jgi:ComF family protein